METIARLALQSGSPTGSTIHSEGAKSGINDNSPTIQPRACSQRGFEPDTDKPDGKEGTEKSIEARTPDLPTTADLHFFQARLIKPPRRWFETSLGELVVDARAARAPSWVLTWQHRTPEHLWKGCAWRSLAPLPHPPVCPLDHLGDAGSCPSTKMSLVRLSVVESAPKVPTVDLLDPPRRRQTGSLPVFSHRPTIAGRPTVAKSWV